MKTQHPLILTARIHDDDLEPFDALRRLHFPPDRNFLRAHLTMFHRLPGEYIGRIAQELESVANGAGVIEAQASGLRHLGAGVAVSIASSGLHDVRDRLKASFVPWLGSQDMQPWKPHITVQNKVERAVADSLHKTLADTFQPRSLRILGLDLWAYLGGPWRFEASALFGTDTAGRAQADADDAR